MTHLFKLAKNIYYFYRTRRSSAILRFHGCRTFGRNVYLGNRVKVRHGECLTLGDEVFIADGCHLRSEGGDSKITLGDKSILAVGVMLVTHGGSIELGTNCSVNEYCILHGHGGLTIGNNVSIATGTVIVPGNHRYERRDIPFKLQGSTCKGIVLEDDIWVGAHATLLDGIRVGKGAIIAAGSVVTHSVAPYTIVAGVPAKFLKERP